MGSTDHGGYGFGVYRGMPDTVLGCTDEGGYGFGVSRRKTVRVWGLHYKHRNGFGVLNSRRAHGLSDPHKGAAGGGGTKHTSNCE